MKKDFYTKEEVFFMILQNNKKWEDKIEKIKNKIRVIKGSNKVNRDYNIDCGYTLDLIDKICEEEKE